MERPELRAMGIGKGRRRSAAAEIARELGLQRLAGPAAVPTPGEVALLEGLAKSARDRLMVRTFYATGMRLNELATLRPEAVGERSLFVAGKGEKDRHVLMDRVTAELMHERCGQLGPGATVIGLSRRHIGKTIHTYCVKAGLYQQYEAQGKRLSPHSFRYAFATHAYENGMNLFTLKRLLGHTFLDTTVLYMGGAVCDWRAAYENAHPFGSGPRGSRVAGESEELGYHEEIAEEFGAELAATDGFRRMVLVPTPEEVAQLLGAPPAGSAEAKMLRLLYASGLRPSEAAEFSPDWLGSDGCLRVGGRVVPLDRETLGQLPAGGCAEVDAIAVRYAEATGLAARYAALGRQFTARALRHAYATHCLENGMELFVLYRLLGHGHIATTSNLYAGNAVGLSWPDYEECHPYRA